jgi:hypothetical protein
MMMRSSSLMIVVTLLGTTFSYSRDRGQFAGSTPEMRAWFENLRSGQGPCCSDADGTALSDVDWQSQDGHYIVRIDRHWIDVPESAVLHVPNKAGITMTWPIYLGFNRYTIRCFILGAMI